MLIYNTLFLLVHTNFESFFPKFGRVYFVPLQHPFHARKHLVRVVHEILSTAWVRVGQRIHINDVILCLAHDRCCENAEQVNALGRRKSSFSVVTHTVTECCDLIVLYMEGVRFGSACRYPRLFISWRREMKEPGKQVEPNEALESSLSLFSVLRQENHKNSASCSAA